MSPGRAAGAAEHAQSNSPGLQILRSGRGVAVRQLMCISMGLYSKQLTVYKSHHAGAFGDERQWLLECPALADVRTPFSQLNAHCSGIMARLVWFRDQPLVIGTS